MFTFKKQEKVKFWATSILITTKKKLLSFYNDKEQKKKCFCRI